MFDKFLFGNKQIPEMYFGNIPVAQIYFGDTLVWEKASSKHLLAGTQFVSFEFIPTSDITLDHVGIFTSDAYTGTTINFAIYHESGLVVAKTDADTASSTEEKYGLTGQRRVVAVNGVLKRGLKYYIQYTDQNGNTIHPAYFQNSQSSETGETGKYKVFTHNQAQNKSVADLSNVNNYRGMIDTVNAVFAMNAGDFFLWTGNGTLNANSIYVRSSIGANTPFAGIIGNQSSPQTITAQDMTDLVSVSKNAAIMWCITNYPHMTTNTFWKKVSDFPTATVDFTGLSTKEAQFGHLLYEMTRQSVTELICNNGPTGDYSWGPEKGIGVKFKLKDGYVNMVTSDTPISGEITDPVENGIYYSNQWGWVHIALYKGNGQWETDTNVIQATCLETKALDEQLSSIGTVNDLISQDWGSAYISEGLRSASIEQDTKKFYLEINGDEK